MLVDLRRVRQLKLWASRHCRTSMGTFPESCLDQYDAVSIPWRTYAATLTTPVRNCSLVGAAILLGASSVSYADAVSTTPNVSPDDDSITAASKPTNQLVSKFTSFAGSTTNAQALVNGL